MDKNKIGGFLLCNRLRIQNANAISSPLTWGFPAMTAFLGLMWALERKLNGSLPIIFERVGVICHSFEPQISSGSFERAFRLTRNPLTKDGETPAISEEGRVHLEISLVFGVSGGILDEAESLRNEAASEILNTLSQMRVAGGTIVQNLKSPRRGTRIELMPLPADTQERESQFARLRRKLIPGFALVQREDLLQKRLVELREKEPASNTVDAWLDFSRITYEAKPNSESDGDNTAAWSPVLKKGWVVPIPVGFGSISDVYPAGSVMNARDKSVEFQFVESLYSVGEWIGPHRLRSIEDILWYADNDLSEGVFVCRNNYAMSFQESVN